MTRISSLWTYPRRGEAGQEHESIEVTAAGLAGDRPKRAAVSVIGADSPGHRANIVLDVTTADVESLAGRVGRIGEALLAFEVTGNACHGVYAAVGEGGVLRVGDEVVLVDDAEDGAQHDATVDGSTDDPTSTDG